MKALRAILGLSSLVSMYVAGILGLLTVRAVGPYLAMAAQMMSGNTEPSHPHILWPWATVFCALMLPVPLMYRRSWGLATVAAVPLALLPFWQLWRLYLAARGA